MTILNLQQGTDAWHQHRAESWNASDAPAMLGVSPYKTRSQLIEERATGIAAEVDEATQRRFEAGHAAEAEARPHAEETIGDDLYPCVVADGRYSASLDGMTMDGEIIFEHKLLNADLRSILASGNASGTDLPEYHRAQIEQQLMISGATKCLFMASANGERYWTWYTPDPAMRERIIAGWNQFEQDVASYVPEPAKHRPVAAPVEGFGTLSLRVEGRVLASNLDAFKAGAEAFIARLPRPEDLQTDQDFADAKAAVKACEEAEERIESAKETAQAEMTDIDAAFRLADSLKQTIRAARLALDKVVKTEEQARRAEIVQRAADSVRAHYGALNADLGEYRISPPQPMQYEISQAIKNKKTLDSITNAAESAAANAKIAGTQLSERVKACITVIHEAVDNSPTPVMPLLPDRVQLALSKSPEDLRNLISARVAEAERIQLAQQESEAKVAAVRAEPEPPPFIPDGCIRRPFLPGVPLEQPKTAPPIKLGEINELIAPLSIGAAGLMTLGFNPIESKGAAKLYAASDLPKMRNAMIEVLQGMTL